jgi:hypothetical protein
MPLHISRTRGYSDAICMTCFGIPEHADKTLHRIPFSLQALVNSAPEDNAWLC